MDRKLRFWRWFRSIPLMAVMLVGVVSFAMAIAPSALIRRVLLPVSYEDYILDSSARHGVDPLLVCAIIKCESDWEPAAESDAGAQGLMQVMPSTAETLVGLGYVDGYSFDAANLTDPRVGIEYGCACLQYMQDHLENTDQVIAAYNAGLGTVQDWMDGGLPEISDAITYPETRLYLIKVNEAYSGYLRLYGYDLQPL